MLPTSEGNGKVGCSGLNWYLSVNGIEVGIKSLVSVETSIVLIIISVCSNLFSFLIPAGKLLFYFVVDYSIYKSHFSYHIANQSKILTN